MTTDQKTFPPESKALALSPERERWIVLQKQCKAFISSGLLPKHVTHDKDKRPLPPEVAMAKALTIVSAGAEIGTPPLQSLRSIRIIDGTPSFAAELMLANCYKKVDGFGLQFITPKEKEKVECTAKCWRKGVEPQEFHFTLEDAKRAGLVRPNSGWEKYVTDMLQSRVISRACRRVAPEATMGFYTPEELGADVIDVEPSAPVKTISVASTTTVIPPEAPATNMVQEKKPAIPQYRPGAFLTEKQINRLYAIATKQKWTDEDIHAYMVIHFKKEHTRDLLRSEYDQLCNFILGGGRMEVVDAEYEEIGSDDDIRKAGEQTSSDFAPEATI